MKSEFEVCQQLFFDFLYKTYKEPNKIIFSIFRASLQTIYADYIKQHADSKHYYMLAQTILQKNTHGLMLETMIELAKKFSSSNIKCVFLKGLTLENELYPPNIFRPSSDIDILIAHNDIPKVIKIINTLGYKDINGEPYTKANIIKDGGDHHLLPINKIVICGTREISIRVEIHIHFTKSYGTARRRYSKLNPLQFDSKDNITENAILRSKLIAIAGQNFYVLDSMDNIIFIADHFAHHYTDALFLSFLNKENPYPSVSTRSVFETLLLAQKYFQTQNNVHTFLSRCNVLDNQTQWGVYLTLRCCNYIASNIVSNELVERYKSQLKQIDFKNPYEVLLYVLIQNIPDILYDSKEIEHKIICEATRLFQTRKQSALPAEFIFNSKNCNIIAFDYSSILKKQNDTGHLQATLRITKQKLGLHFHIEFSDNEYKQYNKDILRININMVFSGKENSKNRIQYVMLASVKDIIWASIKENHYLKKRAGFKYITLHNGFIADFNLTWNQLGFHDAKPDKMLFAISLIHVDEYGNSNYILSQSGIHYDIENFISINL